MADGRKSGDLQHWDKRLMIVLDVARRHIAILIEGKLRPTEDMTVTGAQAALDTAISDYRGNEDRY